MEMIDNKTKNLLKKPANGGIPAIENKIKPKQYPNTGLLKPIPDQFARYFG
jgi:hypothetical protein